MARLYIQPSLGSKKMARLTAEDIRLFLDTLRTQCRCCTRDLAARRLRCCATGECCRRRLSPLALAYIHSILKSVLEHAVREEENPRNVVRNVRMGTPHPKRTEPFTSPKPAASSKPPAATGCTPCSSSPCTPASARAHSSACTGQTSTSLADCLRASKNGNCLANGSDERAILLVYLR
ncbi:hypothetical protein [Streptomyces sp. NPDC050759]|uniref:hypothetical protein n=1 Tax=Streptomyces sp. NPDC050759 TaxID=3365635 RepID=UPI00378D1E5B